MENDNDRLDTIRRLWVARSSVGGQVARRPSWSPLFGGRQSRCAAGLVLSCGAQEAPATLVPSRWTFALRHMLDTGELM